jgi:hypothetical protein
MLQRDLHQQLRAESAAARDHIATLTRPLNAAQLNEHPEPKGWSIGEVLEHLLIADELYDDTVARLLASSRPDAGAALRDWKPSFLGKWIAESLIAPKLNLGDAFRIHVVHVTRHAKQVERLAGRV